MLRLFLDLVNESVLCKCTRIISGGTDYFNSPIYIYVVQTTFFFN
jgi:hypothetical protein